MAKKHVFPTLEEAKEHKPERPKDKPEWVLHSVTFTKDVKAGTTLYVWAGSQGPATSSATSVSGVVTSIVKEVSVAKAESVLSQLPPEARAELIRKLQEGLPTNGSHAGSNGNGSTHEGGEKPRRKAKAS